MKEAALERNLLAPAALSAKKSSLKSITSSSTQRKRHSKMNLIQGKQKREVIKSGDTNILK